MKLFLSSLLLTFQSSHHIQNSKLSSSSLRLLCRSNRINIRLESLYLALKELQSVLSHWRQLNDLSDLTEKNEQKALKHLKAAFDNDLAFIDSFLQDLNTFQSRLLEHFLQPLKNVFPVYLPTEILLKIWQMCLPQTVLPVNFIDRKEARKFLLLIKTTVLAAYNLAILGAVCIITHIYTESFLFRNISNNLEVLQYAY